MSLPPLIGLALLAPGSPGEWAQFRGPGGAAAVADGEALPEVLDDSTLRWRRPLGPGHASPVVSGGLVFATEALAAEGGGLELATLALDARTGELRWRASLSVDAREEVHEVNGHASSTPAAGEDGVYCHFGAFGLVAYGRDGSERWRRSLPVPDNTFGTAASPILAGGLLLMNRDANDGSWLEAFDPSDGSSVWRAEREHGRGGKSGWSTPFVHTAADGTPEVLVYAPQRLVAYELATGAQRWTAPGLTDEPCTTPTAGTGLVFVTSYNMKTNPEVEGVPPFGELIERHDGDGDGTLDRSEAEAVGSVLSRHDARGEGDHPLVLFFRFLDGDQDGEIAEAEYAKLVAWVDSFDFANGLIALDPGDAERPPEVVWTETRGVPECPSPLFHDARVYLVKNGGILSCLDAATGELVYRERLGAPGPRYASPVVGDGKLYLASAEGVVTVVAAGDEPRVLGQSDLGGRILATPALAGGLVYVRTADALLAHGVASPR